MELGLIRKVDIDSEMQQSYLDYAMSVIVSRALPDARDGLKPVQRRILFAMYDMGLRQDSAYKKSARIVGEVLGKYHPHGDMAVYEAMARMAQDFSMRYMLVNGQGNFGSVDGDPPAAMRYTEARLTPTAIDMINQIEKNTVNFVSNFDDTLQEPEVLPAALPNLLVNGATGIAVGMATNIPPHNLGEVVDALIYMLEQWDRLDDIPIDHLMRYIQGPDFPTGGMIIQDPQGDGLMSAYSTGRGKVIVQARAHLEEMVRGRNRIIVTELPYMTNKASLIERIAELVREAHLEGIADLRDESDRQGMRIVIELTKTADPEKILRDLYHRTPMQTTFGIALLALVDGEPRMLTLKQALKVYLEHRLTVVRRRSEFDLARARQRAHILEGLRIALQHLDEIIQLIRGSADADQAKKRLMTRFKLSEIQAQAILDMPLRRLAALERKKIELEYKEVVDLIKSLETLLRSPKKMRQVVIDELQAVRKAYADRRRTQIVRLKEGVSIASMLTTTDVVPAQTVWVSAMEDGRIARSLDEAQPKLTGTEAPILTLRTNTHHTLYLVAETGRAAAVPVHALPVCENPSDGPGLSKICPLREDERISAVFALPPKNNGDQTGYLLSVSRLGLVKKTALSELPGPSAQAFLLAKVNEGDRLGWVLLTSGQDELLLASAGGMSIRFTESEVRPMGLVAAGVGGIKLAADDELVTAMMLPSKGEVVLFASDGRAKRVPYKDFPVQGRYGQGAIAWKFGKGLRLVGGAAGPAGLMLTLHLAKSAAKAVRLGEVPAATRAGQGKSIVDVKPGDSLLMVSTPRNAEIGQEVAPVEKPKRAKSRAVVQDENLSPIVGTQTLAPNGGSAAMLPSDGEAETVRRNPRGGSQQKKATVTTGDGRASGKKASPVERRSRDSGSSGKVVETAATAKPGKKSPTRPNTASSVPGAEKKTKTSGRKTPRATASKPAGKADAPASSKPGTSGPSKTAKAAEAVKAKPGPRESRTNPAGKAVVPAARKAAAGKPAARKSAGRKPAAGKPAAEKPTSTKPGRSRTTGEKEKPETGSTPVKPSGTAKKTTPSSKGVAEIKTDTKAVRARKSDSSPTGKP